MTDERQCAWCGEGYFVHHAFNGSPPQVEAASSTDEGEARWERWSEAGEHAFWRRQRQSVSHSSVNYSVPLGVEAAIRAPLEVRIRKMTANIDRALSRERNLRVAAEERIRELEAQCAEDDYGSELSRASISWMEAENERLREALSAVVGDYLSGSRGGSSVTVRVRRAAVERARTLLATPPSSTEGTKEVDG